ncbi:MAG: hypothetical protein ACK5ML_01380 [Lachnospiraceae bacterium]
MSELLLCNQGLAQVPYHFTDSDLNIYSLEELSYYIMQNHELLDTEFMDENLCVWIRNHCHEVRLAEELEKLRNMPHGITAFVRALLQSNSYCTVAEIKEITAALEVASHRTKEQRQKLKADRMFQLRLYSQSIEAYQQIIDQLDEHETNGVLKAQICYNLGAAYANLFQFDLANHCFCKAFQQDPRPKYQEAAEKAEALLHQAETRKIYDSTSYAQEKEQADRLFLRMKSGSEAMIEEVRSRL